MEDTLREITSLVQEAVCEVLILVLMEDTLRVKNKNYGMGLRCCLNPCFNGRYS